MPNEVTVSPDFQHIFILFFVKILKYNRPELGWYGFDVASWRVEIGMHETVSGVRVVR